MGDVATYINGYAFKPSDYSDTGLPIIRIQDLTGNAYQTNRYEGILSERYAVDDGDILISWSASLGVFEWDGGPAWLNQHIFKVSFDKMQVDKRFFVHQARFLMEASANLAHGATMRHLTKKVFDSLPFYFPRSERQRAIADQLDGIDMQLCNATNQLYQLDSLVKSRFVGMFENRGYPRISIGDLVTSKVPSAKDSFNDADLIKYIDISSIDNSLGEVTKFTECIFGEAPSRAQQCVSFGDLLVSTVRPNLKNIAVTKLDGDNVVASSGFCVLRCVGCPVEYMKAIVGGDRFTREMCRLTTGANYPAIKNRDILGYMIPYPPMEQMDTFATFVQRVDKLRFAGNHEMNLRCERFTLSWSTMA
ncbi:restriction endonuclease subunit S [Adlercreutzia caecimuris]|uniref:restriction endonuclease subunit S n=1 Tax=Adlercreutzia caecimuris TaxID=671266 RepID=UPI0024947A1D|nr:restriction endonuclease subunit S [Adlercreutzia caecimuris]